MKPYFSKSASIKRTSSVIFLLAACFLSPLKAHAENWALLIGIDKYSDVNRINDLSAAGADAKAIAETLQQACGFKEDHIELLVSDGETKPTRNNILTGLSRLTKNAKPGDTVFVFYSGHGVEIGGLPYLLPYDTGALDDGLLANTALPASAFREYLGRVHARALVLAFDMCRTDPQKSGKDITTADNPLSDSLARSFTFKDSKAGKASGSGDSAVASSLVIELLSCKRDERSYEWHDKGRGYFSYFLEQGLRGKAADTEGNVTAELLANYVSKEVAKKVESNEHKPQTPLPSLDGNGVQDFVLSRSAWRLTNVPRPIATKAQLAVSVNVPQAAVVVDGEPITNGTYAANLLDEPEKTVQITVSAPGYETVTMNVVLHRGKTQQQAITLNLSPTNSVPAVVKKPEPALVPQYFIQEARAVADGMTNEGRSVAIAEIVQSQRAMGDTEGANRSVQEVNKIIADELENLKQSRAAGMLGPAMTRISLVYAQATMGDLAGARANIAEAKSSALQVGNAMSRVAALTRVATIQSLIGDDAAARTSINDAKNAAIKGTGREGLALCLAEIAVIQATIGDVTDARHTITKAQETAEQVHDSVKISGALSWIAQAQAACGDIDDAKATAENVVNIYRKSEALGAISKAQAKNGDIAGALATAAPIVGDNRKAEALVEIAKKQAARGDLAGARDTAASIVVAYLKANAFAEIARVMAGKNK